ncbi:6165_t:CDS:10 [Entrophospora sp. SA101]|nr:6165_t:CDS:10 [Entrophospora sp. SA101]
MNNKNFLKILLFLISSLLIYYVNAATINTINLKEIYKLQHNEFYEELKIRNISIKVRHEFVDLINAISFEVEHLNHLEIIKDLPNVDSVEPIMIHQGPKFINKSINQNNGLNKRDWISHAPLILSSKIDLNTPHHMTGVDWVHKHLDVTGRGVRVGVIDTGKLFAHFLFYLLLYIKQIDDMNELIFVGIDYRHPAFGGCFGPGCIIGALDDASGLVGVAPDVTFGAYRAMDCSGQGSDDALIKALEQASRDNMDIVNLSLGGNFWASTPLSDSIGKMIESGVVVAVADGNSGLDGLWKTISSAFGYKSLSVASVENSHFLGFKAHDINDNDCSLEYLTVTARALPFDKGEVVMFPKHSCPEDLSVYHNKILYLDLSSNSTSKKDCPPLPPEFVDKLLALIISKVDLFDPILANFDIKSLKLPMATILSRQANKLVERLKKNPGGLEFDFSDKRGYMIQSHVGGTVSYFSSWGLTPYLDIKEIAAPGGIIFSTFPINLGSYANLMGTSMATPYISGVAALIRQANKIEKNSHRFIQKALMNYAIPVHDQIFKIVPPVLRQGAGLVNVYNSIRAMAFVHPFKLALNDTVNGKKDGYYDLSIENYCDKHLEYRLVHMPAVSVNGYDGEKQLLLQELKYRREYAVVNFKRVFIKIEPFGKEKITLKITPPKDLPSSEHWFYSGFIKFVPVDSDDPIISVPYGAAKTLPIFAKPDYPQLYYDSKSLYFPNETATYGMKNKTDAPIILISLSTPTKLLLVQVLDENQKLLGFVPGKGVGGLLAGYNEYLTKTGSHKFLILLWAGSKNNATNSDEDPEILPNGAYHLRIRALRLLGDIDKEEDWEVWL